MIPELSIATSYRENHEVIMRAWGGDENRSLRRTKLTTSFAGSLGPSRKSPPYDLPSRGAGRWRLGLLPRPRLQLLVPVVRRTGRDKMLLDDFGSRPPPEGKDGRQYRAPSRRIMPVADRRRRGEEALRREIVYTTGFARSPGLRGPATAHARSGRSGGRPHHATAREQSPVQNVTGRTDRARGISTW